MVFCYCPLGDAHRPNRELLGLLDKSCIYCGECFVVFAATLGMPKTEANALFSLVVFTLGSVFLFLFFALHFKMAVEKNNLESDLNKDAVFHQAVTLLSVALLGIWWSARFCQHFFQTADSFFS